MPEVLAKQVRPFYGRATLVESPVDETQRESGVILPHTHDDDDGVMRGVILDVDNPWPEGSPAHIEAEQLPPGTVVWYRGGTKIRDVIVIELQEIIGFETDLPRIGFGE